MRPSPVEERCWRAQALSRVSLQHRVAACPLSPSWRPRARPVALRFCPPYGLISWSSRGWSLPTAFIKLTAQASAIAGRAGLARFCFGARPSSCSFRFSFRKQSRVFCRGEYETYLPAGCACCRARSCRPGLLFLRWQQRPSGSATANLGQRKQFRPAPT